MAMSMSDSGGRRTPGAGAPAHEARFDSLIGAGPRMRRIFRLIKKVAATDSTVLLLGESGSGKELVARSIHLQSRRAGGPFVPVNVGALAGSLIESELFGHQRGAFTGATSDRRGLIEEADGGTLFLDEIGDMPLATQVNLLRVLENSEVRRVGGNVARHVDVRVIAATHHDLMADVAAGRFREDLYYRLNVVQIELPPLRERREDIGLLSSYFLERIAVTVADGPVITASDLPAVFGVARQLAPHAEPARAGADAARPAAGAADAMAAAPAPQDGDRDSWSLADVEREHIQRVLRVHRGNATGAAKQLGISRTTLWRKLRAYGLARREP